MLVKIVAFMRYGNQHPLRVNIMARPCRFFKNSHFYTFVCIKKINKNSCLNVFFIVGIGFAIQVVRLIVHPNPMFSTAAKL